MLPGRSSTYNVRVGRSTDIKGPYVDRRGETHGPRVAAPRSSFPMTTGVAPGTTRFSSRMEPGGWSTTPTTRNWAASQSSGSKRSRGTRTAGPTRLAQVGSEPSVGTSMHRVFTAGADMIHRCPCRWSTLRLSVPAPTANRSSANYRPLMIPRRSNSSQIRSTIVSAL